MKAFLALVCVVIGWVSVSVAQERPAHDFDRQKLERTRALFESREEGAAGLSSTAAPLDLQSSIGTMGKGLILTLAVFFIGIHVYRRFSGAPNAGATRSMRILEKMAVSNRCTVLLVEVQGQQHLIATGSESVTFGPMLSQKLSSFARDLESAECKPAQASPLGAQIERDIVWHGA